MTYETLITDTSEALPEFAEAYAQALERGLLVPEDGKHIVFSYVFVPLLFRAIETDDALTKKMFAFIEQMETSGDRLVGEVADFTVLEELADHCTDDVMRYMGTETLESFRYVRKYIGGPSSRQHK